MKTEVHLWDDLTSRIDLMSDFNLNIIQLVEK